MFDLLLILLVFGIFYAGFKAGNKYASIKDMVKELLDSFD